MATQLLMPKATAVWLVDNTALSFEQIAQFCKLHPLEVSAIADGDVPQGIGHGPDHDRPVEPRRDRARRGRHQLPPRCSNRRCAYLKPSARDHATRRCQASGSPNAILWLVRNHQR